MGLLIFVFLVHSIVAIYIRHLINTCWMNKLHISVYLFIDKFGQQKYSEYSVHYGGCGGDMEVDSM